LLEVTFGRAGYVFIYRPNRIAQAISRVIATQTGVWHGIGATGAYTGSATSIDSAYNRLAIFWPCDIMDHLTAIADEERRLRMLHSALKGHNLGTVAALYDGSRFLFTSASAELPEGVIAALSSTLAIFERRVIVESLVIAPGIRGGLDPIESFPDWIRGADGGCRTA
jgi:hypothetical protein